MKAVLDVGQFVSATIVPQGHPAQILSAWREGLFELFISFPILEDLRRVLSYPHIRKRHGWSDEEIQVFVDSLVLSASVTAGALEVEAIGDATHQTTKCSPAPWRGRPTSLWRVTNI